MISCCSSTSSYSSREYRPTCSRSSTARRFSSMKRTVPFCGPLCPGLFSDGDGMAGDATTDGVFAALFSRSRVLPLRLFLASSCAGEVGEVPLRLAGEPLTPFEVALLLAAALGEMDTSARDGDSVKRGRV